MENEKKIVRLPFFGMPLIWPYIKKYKKIFILMITTGVIFSAMDSLYPLFNRYAINHYVAEETLDTLGIFIGRFQAPSRFPERKCCLRT